MADKPSLITLTDPSGAAAEAYRTLSDNLRYVQLEAPLTSLVITSPAAGDGKSLVLANLAVASAQSGKKVIIVDSDLRRPVLTGLFGLTGERGLSTVIDGSASLDSSLVADVGIDGLRILPTGELPPNPPDLLDSKKMEQVIDALKQPLSTCPNRISQSDIHQIPFDVEREDLGADFFQPTAERFNIHPLFSRLPIWAHIGEHLTPGVCPTPRDDG